VIKNKDDRDCKDPNPDAILSQPHSSSFIDLNGDCLADIFMTMYKEYESESGEKKSDNYFDIYVQKIVEYKDIEGKD